MYSESDFTQEKVNFHATSGIPISLALPLAAAALWMIICKRLAPRFKNYEKGMKMHF